MHHSVFRLVLVGELLRRSRAMGSGRTCIPSSMWELVRLPPLIFLSLSSTLVIFRSCDDCIDNIHHTCCHRGKRLPLYVLYFGPVFIRHPFILSFYLISSSLLNPLFFLPVIHSHEQKDSTKFNHHERYTVNWPTTEFEWTCDSTTKIQSCWRWAGGSISC